MNSFAIHSKQSLVRYPQPLFLGGLEAAQKWARVAKWPLVWQDCHRRAIQKVWYLHLGWDPADAQENVHAAW